MAGIPRNRRGDGLEPGPIKDPELPGPLWPYAEFVIALVFAIGLLLWALWAFAG